MPRQDGVIWVDKLTFALVDGNVLFTSTSGSVEYQARISRAAFRELVENGQRALDAADIAEATAQVIPFR